MEMKDKYKNFFENKNIQVPIDSKDNFIEHITELKEKYIKATKTAGIDQDIQDWIHIFDELIGIVKQYHQGFISLSYKLFRDMLDKLHILEIREKNDDEKAILQIDGNSVPYDDGKLVQVLDKKYSLFDSIKVTDYFYRIREMNGNPISFKKNDMFHIPYHLRTKVNNFRYSISGNPGLYMGGSIYICWKEMDEPEKFSVSAYKCKLEIKKILDLRFDDKKIDKIINYDNGNNNAKLLVILWPLIMLCNIRKNKGAVHFAPEYIIPQILYHTLKILKYPYGVAYYSTRVNNDCWNKHSLKCTNIALHSDEDKYNGYSEKLSKYFDYSETEHIETVIVSKGLSNNEIFRLFTDCENRLKKKLENSGNKAGE